MIVVWATPTDETGTPPGRSWPRLDMTLRGRSVLTLTLSDIPFSLRGSYGVQAESGIPRIHPWGAVKNPEMRSGVRDGEPSTAGVGRRR